MTDKRRDALGLLLGFVGVVIFGATLPMTRLALRSFDPATVTIGRALIAALAAALLLAVLRRPFPRAHLRTLVLIGLCVVIGFPGFTSLALQTVPAAHGGVVLGILPLATALAAALVAHERPSAAFWGWSVAGALIVIGFSLHGANGLAFELGDLFLLLACACAATGYAMSGRLARLMPGWEVISWVLVTCLPLLLVLFVPVLPRVNWNAAPVDWAAFVYLGLMSQFMGFFFWNAGMAIGGVARVGQVQLLQTFVTLGLSALLVGETIDALTIAAAIGVAGVVFLGRKAPIRRPAEA